MSEKRELKHYGIIRRSGRYPWGSGTSEYQRSMLFYGMVNSMRDAGLSDKEIADGIGVEVRQLTGDDAANFSISDLRSTRTIAKAQIVLEQTNRAVALRDKGVHVNKIADELGIPVATVRLRLKKSEDIKETALLSTAKVLKENVDSHKIVDIGKGTEHHLGIADTRLKAAVALLRDEGYETYSLPIKNVGTNNFTKHLVLVPPGTGFAEARRMSDKIHTMGEWTEDNGLTYFGIHSPMAISSKRLKVVYGDEGGADLDGTVYVRPGVKDLDMGKNNYAQVRINIDDTHFIKGMAVLNKDLPDGVDLVFHTNKTRDKGKLGVLKPMKDDPDNPFGSVIKRQIVDIDPKTGKERLKSGINLVNEEGDWDAWRNSLPSQMLAKQPHTFIKSQLQVTRDETKARLDEINKITNPVVKRKKLQDFADQIDADAVDLRAAAMPRQRTQVIIPVPGLNKNEIYAPNFVTGEPVTLIRYPHGGRFEIPEVVVNNNNRKAKALLGNAPDAIGIHPSVAVKLSGADFDGDTVVVIPNRSGQVKGSNSMPGHAAKVYESNLKDFDAKRKYGNFEQSGVDKDGKPVGNFPLMKNTGMEMGMITNLITDMSIQGATPEHVVRAVRHSMVVIDAEKHQLDYRRSEMDNGIKQLKTLYQGKPDSGATTLLSLATSKERIPERKLRPAAQGGAIDKDTGALKYVDTGKTRNKYDPKTGTYMDGKDGRPLIKEPVMQKEKRLALTDDAFTLTRDPKDPVERLYATHANEMKALANKTRLQADRIPNPKINPKAKEQYRSDIDNLVSQLKAAEKQKPLDRRADVLAGVIVKAKRAEDPTLRTDPDRLKKVERQAKAAARGRLGLTKPVIDISDTQWDAIQAGGVSASRLAAILKYADPKRVEELSMPRQNTVMTTAIASRARAMLAAGATNAEVAAALGVPQSTLRAAAKRGEV